MDKQDRKGLKYGEASSLRTLFAAVSSMGEFKGGLEQRLKAFYPGEWERLEGIVNDLFDLLNKLTETVPEERMWGFREELKHIRLLTEVYGKPKAVDNGATYVPIDALERMIDRVTAFKCFACERRGGEISRCAVYRDIQEMYHHDFPKAKGSCPFAGATPGYIGGCENNEA